MKIITLIKPNGSTIELNSRIDKRSVSSAKVRKAIMGDDVLELTVVSVGAINISIGDKIRAFGGDYFVNTIPQALRKSQNVFSYILTLESDKYDLAKVLFVNSYESSDPESEKTVCTQVDFSVTGIFSVFMDKIMENISRIYGENMWSYEIATQSSDPEFKPDYQESKTLTFSSVNVLSGLCSVCEAYGVEFYIGRNGYKKILIGKTGTHHTNITFEYGKGKGLYSISRTNQSDKNIVTRLYAFGSSSNLGNKYRGGKKRLELPLATYADNCIQDADVVRDYGIVESAVVFDDIFPSRESTVTSIETGKELVFYDASMDFDLNEKDDKGNSIYIIDQGGVTIAFNSGKLAGYDFTLVAYNHTERRFTLIPFTDENEFTFPSKDDSAFQISKDDKYTILGVSLPQSYVNAAELKLEEKAIEKYKEYCRPSYSYALSIDEVFLKDKYLDMEQRDIFSPADYITIKDGELIKDQQMAVRVVGMSHDVLYPYRYELTLSDVVTPSVLTQLVKSAIKTDSIIKINKLDDLSRTRRNARSTAQLRDMIFDTDGYFNGGKIRTQTIETLMLSVGSKSGEFVLSELLFNPNYGGNPNHIHNTEGHLIHYGIEENIRTWELMAATKQDLVSEKAYYIYARCQRSVGSSYAQALYSTEQWKFDSEEGWYLFLIGVLHSVGDGYRDISLSYGSTTINGQHITTGRISSPDGKTYFDLDKGEIGGKIVFTDQSAYVDENGNKTTIIESGKINTELLEVKHIAAERGSIAQFDIAENKLTGKAGTIIFQNDEIAPLSEIKQTGTVLNIPPPPPTPITNLKSMEDHSITVINIAEQTITADRVGLVNFGAYGKGEFALVPPDPNAYISTSQTKIKGYVIDEQTSSAVDVFDIVPDITTLRVSYLPKAGNYTLRVITTATASTAWVEPQEKYPTLSVTAHSELRGTVNGKIQFVSLDKSTVIGTNGLFSIWSQQEYFYFASQQGLNVRGDIELYSPNGEKGLRITNNGIEGIGEVIAPQADWNASEASLGAIKNKPTKLSQFTNDPNYITQAQCLGLIGSRTYDKQYIDGNFIKYTNQQDI